MNKNLNKNGLRMQAERKRLKMTQRVLAEKAGYTPVYISNLENGKKNVSADVAVRLSEIFHVRIEYLMGKDDIRTNEDVIILSVFDDWAREYVNNLVYELGYRVIDFRLSLPPTGITFINPLEKEPPLNLAGSTDFHNYIYLEQYDNETHTPDKEIYAIHRNVYLNFIEDIFDYVKMKINQVKKHSLTLADDEHETIKKLRDASHWYLHHKLNAELANCARDRYSKNGRAEELKHKTDDELATEEYNSLMAANRMNNPHYYNKLSPKTLASHNDGSISEDDVRYLNYLYRLFRYAHTTPFQTDKS